MTIETFDIVYASDIFVQGGTNAALASHVEYLSGKGFRVGILPMHLPHARMELPIYERIRRIVSAGKARIIERSTRRVSCDLFLIDNPSLLEVPLDEVPDVRIEARERVMIVPFPAHDARGFTYNPTIDNMVAQRLCSGPYKWAPVAPLVRNLLKKHYPLLPLTVTEPVPIVDHRRYKIRTRTPGKVIIIGRHSRPQAEKWPRGRKQFLQAYPSSTSLRHEFLGISRQELEALYGSVPKNIKTARYNAEPVHEFLDRLDFFVYYHHPTWIEALGIVVVEAMLSKLPCILPPYMEENFGSNAIYAEPEKVAATLAAWRKRPRALHALAERAYTFARETYGPKGFQRFLDEIGLSQRRSQTKRRVDMLLVADMSQNTLRLAQALETVAAAKADGQLCAVRNSGHYFSTYAKSFLAETSVPIADPGQRARHVISYQPFSAQALAALDAAEAELVHFRCDEKDLNGVAEATLRAMDHWAPRVIWEPLTSKSRIHIERLCPNFNISVAIAPLLSIATRRYMRSRTHDGKFMPVGIYFDCDTDHQIWQAADRIGIDITIFGFEGPRNFKTARNGLYQDAFTWLARISRLVIIRGKHFEGAEADFLKAAAKACGIRVHEALRLPQTTWRELLQHE